MRESILQEYLNAQHIKTDVAENIKNLEKTVQEIKKIFARKKGKLEVIPYTLVALDPNVKDTNPVVQKVEGLIIKKWPAFKNSVTATKDSSITYVRAVILESLRQITKDDEIMLALIWLTARDVIGYYHFGNEANIINNFLQALANQAEANGQSFWNVGRNIVKDVQENKVLISKSVVDEDALVNYLKQAFGSSDVEGSNPHTPVNMRGNYNNCQAFNNSEWGDFTANKSAKGISESMNTALSRQGSSMQTSLNALLDRVGHLMRSMNSSFVDSIRANNKRSDLLWWKEALYCNLLHLSYRKLNLLDAVVATVLDLAEQTEAIYPESVDYLLRETLRDIYGKQVDEERPLTEWLKDSTQLHEGLRAILAGFSEEGNNNKPLLVAWANVLHTGGINEFFDETGIDKKASLTASDLSVWLFHGLQARKLSIDK